MELDINEAMLHLLWLVKLLIVNSKILGELELHS